MARRNAELEGYGSRPRLNDTRAITEKGYQAGERHSICSEKIENGYLVITDTCNPGTGEYKCTKTFTREAPNIRPPEFTGRRGKGINSALADTKTYLRGR